MTSNTGPILVFPRIQPLEQDDFSSLGKVYSREATDSVKCEHSSVSFVMKYCPTSTVVRNPASIQIFINRSCCGSLSTRSWYLCNRSSSCAGSSVKRCVCVSLSHLSRTMGQIVLPQQVALFYHGRCVILRTYLRLLRKD